MSRAAQRPGPGVITPEHHARVDAWVALGYVDTRLDGPAGPGRPSFRDALRDHFYPRINAIRSACPRCRKRAGEACVRSNGRPLAPAQFHRERKELRCIIGEEDFDDFDALEDYDDDDTTVARPPGTPDAWRITADETDPAIPSVMIEVVEVERSHRIATAKRARYADEWVDWWLSAIDGLVGGTQLILWWDLPGGVVLDPTVGASTLGYGLSETGEESPGDVAVERFAAAMPWPVSFAEANAERARFDQWLEEDAARVAAMRKGRR